MLIRFHKYIPNASIRRVKTMSLGWLKNSEASVITLESNVIVCSFMKNEECKLKKTLRSVLLCESFLVCRQSRLLVFYFKTDVFLRFRKCSYAA